MSLKTMVAAIGHFFENLFKSTRIAYNELPKEQQDEIVRGVNLSELLKQGYAKGADFIVSEFSAKLGISEDVAKQVLLHVFNSLGINVTEVQAGLDAFADRVEKTVTDEGHNSLWESIAKIAATWFSTGAISWVTLALGVVEYAYQTIIKNVKE